MIRVQLNQEERDLLQRFRGQSSSKNSEKALMVLLNADGESAVKISEKLNRNSHTVRFWLKRYLAEGLKGLQRIKASGRPRPSKTVSPLAPSPEEKLASVKATIKAIAKLLEQKPCEIFTSDESHFSTEPYLVRGWFKKRWPPQDPEFQQKRKLHHVWMLKFKEAAFLLEAIQAG
jgi:transposase